MLAHCGRTGRGKAVSNHDFIAGHQGSAPAPPHIGEFGVSHSVPPNPAAQPRNLRVRKVRPRERWSLVQDLLSLKAIPAQPAPAGEMASFSLGNWPGWGNPRSSGSNTVKAPCAGTLKPVRVGRIAAHFSDVASTGRRQPLYPENPNTRRYGRLPERESFACRP